VQENIFFILLTAEDAEIAEETRKESWQEQRQSSVISKQCSVLASLSFTVFGLQTPDSRLPTLDWLSVTHHDLKVCVPGAPAILNLAELSVCPYTVES